jgi:hypothetical protein
MVGEFYYVVDVFTLDSTIVGIGAAKLDRKKKF